MQDTRTPVKMSALNLVLYIGLCLALMGPYKHVGIAMGISAATTVQFLAQIWFLRRKIGALGLRRVIDQVWRHAAAGCMMGGVCFAAAAPGRWEEGFTATNALILAGALFAAASAYFLAAWLLAAHDARALLAGLRRRLGRRAA